MWEWPHLPTQVSDATLAILVDQDVLALEVAVCNGRLALRAKDLHVQVGQATGNGERHPQACSGVQRAQLQVVVQGAHLVVVCDQPQLCAGVTRGHVRGNEACRGRRGRDGWIDRQRGRTKGQSEG